MEVSYLLKYEKCVRVYGQHIGLQILEKMHELTGMDGQLHFAGRGDLVG